MKIVDANVLLYAINRNVQQHRAARAWLSGALSTAEPVGLTWIVLLAFIRISTNAALPAPLRPDQAIELVDEWLARPNVVVLEPPRNHLATLQRLLTPLGTAGNLTNDAHIAALALHYDAEVVTFDNDFDRFDGVRRLTPQ